MKDIKAKILMVNTVPMIYDGITMTILNYVTNIDKTDIQIDFLAINHVQEKLKSQIEEMGCEVHTITSRMKNPLAYTLKLAKVVRKEKYKVVHIHCNSRTATFDLLGAFLGGAKLRCPHSHNTQCANPKIHKFLKPLFNLLYTDAFACGVEAGKWLFEDKPFTVLKNGTNLNKYQFDPDAREKYRDKYQLDKKMAVGHVAHFTKQKNHEFLIDVFADVIAKNPNYILFLMGDGKYKNNIVKKVSSINLQNNVVFTGTILEIPEMLSAMDFMVLPSLYEGLPNVVVEWQVSGLQSLLADTITKDCKLTNLVEFIPLDKKAWVDKILKLKIEKKTNQIDKISEAGFNIVTNAEKLKDYYFKRLKLKMNLIGNL